MTTTAWAHLPNAAHIDRVLASLKKNPEKWSAAWAAARIASRLAARNAARDVAWEAIPSAARNAAWSVSRNATLRAGRSAGRSAAEDVAWDAIIALIAWDDCAYILELPEDALKVLRAVGNEQAILLSAAAHALRETSC